MTDEKKVPLSQDAYERLKERLEFLEGEDRQRIINDIAVARAHGDLSENAEYHAAKDEQGQKEAEVRKIRQMIENAEIISGDTDSIDQARQDHHDPARGRGARDLPPRSARGEGRRLRRPDAGLSFGPRPRRTQCRGDRCG